MHRPDDGFAQSSHLFQSLQRQKTLVDPMQVQNIGPRDQWMVTYIQTKSRSRDMEELERSRPFAL